MNNKNGPEFIPLRNFNKECKIDVVVYDTNDKEIRREVMDYGKREDREWLGKLSFYCWEQGWVVETSKQV